MRQESLDLERQAPMTQINFRAPPLRKIRKPHGRGLGGLADRVSRVGTASLLTRLRAPARLSLFQAKRIRLYRVRTHSLRLLKNASDTGPRHW